MQMMLLKQRLNIIITPSAAARWRQMSHKMMVPVLPTPALQ